MPEKNKSAKNKGNSCGHAPQITVSGAEKFLRRGSWAKGVTVVWVLPSSDELAEAERYVRANPGEVPIGIDRSDGTYKAYGVDDLSENCIIGPDGKVLAQGIRDNELFRVTKEILGF